MSNWSRVARQCALAALAIAATAPIAATSAYAQKGKDKPKTEKPASDKPKSDKPKSDKPKVSKLFKSISPLSITLTANFKALKREKQNGAPNHPATLAYVDSTGKTVSVPLRVRTRGIWRLHNCDFPPLRLNFANKTSKGSVFDDLDEPKLVSFCKRGPSAEQYVLQELQLYRAYRLLTPYAHETRLLKIAYVDSASGATEMTRYAFLVEDPARMAERNGGRILDRKGAMPEDLDPAPTAIAFMYLYMVGNTDFSFNSLHNGELLTWPGGRTLPIAYDFDFAGAINAPYAAPAPGLRIRNVRDRQFRGYCSLRGEYPAAVALFESKKAEIYALYSDEIGALIDKRTVKETLEYFDKFYEDIRTPKDLQRNLLGECTDRS